VRGRGETHGHEARCGIPKAGDRSSPVLLLPELALLLVGHPFPISDEPRASGADDDLPTDLFEGVGHTGASVASSWGFP
jgi:hypothetical protein